MIILLAVLALVQTAPAPNLQVRTDHERRGGVIAMLEGLPAQSLQACAAACGLNTNCSAWTFRAQEPPRPARCDLHGHVSALAERPGAATGLSPAVSAAIAAAMDRPLSARERPVLRDGAQPLARGGDELDGG